MLMRFKNKTNIPQQINFIDGSGIKIPAKSPQGGYADIDITNLYKEELNRAQKLFEITPVAPAVKKSHEKRYF